MDQIRINSKVNADVVGLVKRFESVRLKATRLDKGDWTIGYGHKKFARSGLNISPADADLLLIYDLSLIADALESLIQVELNLFQYEALLAFVYNIGLDHFRHSDVLSALNSGDGWGAAKALEKWRKSLLHGEEVILGPLVQRRAAEKAHFLMPTEDFIPASTAFYPPIEDKGAEDDNVASFLPKVPPFIEPVIEEPEPVSEPIALSSNADDVSLALEETKRQGDPHYIENEDVESEVKTTLSLMKEEERPQEKTNTEYDKNIVFPINYKKSFKRKIKYKFSKGFVLFFDFFAYIISGLLGVFLISIVSLDKILLLENSYPIVFITGVLMILPIFAKLLSVVLAVNVAHRNSSQQQFSLEPSARADNKSETLTEGPGV